MCQAIYGGRTEQKQEKGEKEKEKKTSVPKVLDFFGNTKSRTKHSMSVCIHFLNPLKALTKDKT